MMILVKTVIWHIVLIMVIRIFLVIFYIFTIFIILVLFIILHFIIIFDIVSRPFKSLFKRKLGLCSIFPNAGLHSPSFYNFINLFNHLSQHHISILYKLLNSVNLIRDIFLIRLDNLRDKMWLPYSPLNVSNWKPWIDNK